MPEQENGGWDEHRRLVEYRLEGLDTQMSAMRKEQKDLQQEMRDELSSLRREIREGNVAQDKEIWGLKLKVLAVSLGAGIGGGGLGLSLLKVIEKFAG